MLINMCRVCGRSNICTRSLNLFEETNRKLLRHINMLTGLRLKHQQDAPGFICLCCQSDLRIAMAFRKLCIKTQKKWQPPQTQTQTKQDLPSQSDVDSDEVEAEGDSLSQSTRQIPKRVARKEKVCIREMNSEESEPSKPEQTLLVVLKDETSMSDVLSEAADDEHDRLDLSYDTKMETEAEGSSDQDYVQPVSASADRGKGRKHKDKDRITKPQNPKVYICELCGLHVKAKVSFERHIRKHTGERPFPCELCTARFLSAAELRAHHLTHTGERPFPCRYCDRKYVSYMGRLKHERIHTNERPFVCAECGKAFTNSYILKNHMLVHTGERLFRCDLCERSFQRKTHLRTHYRSNTHKHNVEKHENTQLSESPAEAVTVPPLADASKNSYNMSLHCSVNL
ncbi:transcription factor Ouib-like [Scaptodrosophila lebanonensis]|uniref:Transcription factor Ouib-like n=1 Tax=Drosophila lebanonensis TaxID=7225 RepID=A0A6J2TG02_DROLE|nr:transcription factor Ouib-like [Scaptodrosophila lebanonensis]